MDLLTYYSDLAVAYPEYITQKQFCEVCGICHKTAYNLTRRGEISYEIVDTPTGRIHHIKRTVRAVQANGCCCIGKRHSICQCLPQFRS